MYWDKIITTAIALVSALLGGLFTNYLQNNRLKLRREWDIEDDCKKNKKDIIYKRLDELESYYFSFEKYHSSIQCKFSAKNLQEYVMLIKKNEESFPDFLENVHLTYLVSYFNDEKLLLKGQRLLNLYIEMGALLKEFDKAIRTDSHFNNAEYKKKLGDLHIQQAFGEVIKRIDFLRETYLTI